MKKQWIHVLIVAMTLGTTWAIRGHFGHEQGASWAGGIGALALILVSQRKAWHDRMLGIILSAAVGWGAGGMMSYGIVVGYGRSLNFPNAAYGLLMLFVIGGLWGLLGGGMMGLAMNSTKEKRVNWGAISAEMVAGGLLFYTFLITKHQVLMTPPRHETWAICLGAGLAMLWYMARNHFYSPVRVAVITALGTGFGFAFGNFLQTLGTTLEINFNMWNVMEYSLGFFGGGSMAYSVLSAEWPEQSTPLEKWENKSSFWLIFFFIPLVLFIRTLRPDKLMENFSSFTNPSGTAWLTSVVTALFFIGLAVYVWITVRKSEGSFMRKEVRRVFISWFAVYILLSYLVKGVFGGIFLLNLHLYWVNFGIIIFLLGKKYPSFFSPLAQKLETKRGLTILLLALTIILFLAFISVNIHGELQGAHDRFPL